MSKLRRDAGGHLGDDDVLMLMARQVLGGPIDEGRASYQVELTVCDRCERALQLANGELLEVSPRAAEMAKCDAQRLANARVGPSVGDKPARARQDGKPARVRQDVPPAVRRAVLRRDQHRCQAPGCRQADFVDLHHVQPREEGGRHDPENLITLCAAHHRACHGGALSVTGSPSAGLRFRHADGTSYGGGVSAPAAALQTQAFQALRGLGFNEKGALASTAAQVGDDADLQLLLRHALQLLTEHAWQRSA